MLRVESQGDAPVTLVSSLQPDLSHNTFCGSFYVRQSGHPKDGGERGRIAVGVPTSARCIVPGTLSDLETIMGFLGHAMLFISQVRLERSRGM